MTAEDTRPNPEREQTDESLRAEREKADDAIGDGPSAVDETADAIIEKARSRADSVLATARAKSDRRSGAPGPLKAVNAERLREDQVVRQERVEADAALRGERAEHAALLAAERRVTDEDLSRERARSDSAVSTRDEFLGIVTHDLRNILGGMVGLAALIAREADPQAGKNPSEKIVSHARHIQRSGARMNRLIGDLVDLASIAAGSLAVTREVGDVTPIVTEAVDTFQPQALASSVSLAAENAPSMPHIAFDSARILQVLANLLSNAIKFTQPQGRVTVRAERVGDGIRFSVSDTGVGVPPDQLEAIFERYVQVAKNDRRGVGLGLYISKRIIQGHGGRIWVESTLSQGSVFRFTLPVHVAPLASGKTGEAGLKRE
jgi:signal transduction histidine kinase